MNVSKVKDHLFRAPELAETFHRVYEKLAPKYGYKTRKKTRKHWDDLPDNNKKLMVAVAQVILNKYFKKPKVTRKFVEKIINAVIEPLDDFDLPEEQRLYMQITDEIKNDVSKLLKEAGVEEEI